MPSPRPLSRWDEGAQGRAPGRNVKLSRNALLPIVHGMMASLCTEGEQREMYKSGQSGS
jgi:hypothetical protein